ncbi:DUF4362 domain-containing protein [Paenibacillus sp. PL91]|uniref:DUF4362 domain-containing protein n=1 Tax=Paenibacillus sp. PL91 TaxID=2729538 RepID=UPI00145EF07E|nr:DUF4362 domain-containing protein [Paenibacillus sp. PL91]MBC9205080.1 DUF4362 domain-containing protein [Paenibacillus sp. PL91]
MNLLKVVLLISLIITTVGCAKTLNSKDAAKKGYVVYVNSNIQNYELLEGFISDLENGKSADVKIAKYTDEGDLIFHKLSFNEKSINYSYDSSSDENGKKEKLQTTCSGPILNEGKYILTECADESIGQKFFAKQK